MEKFRRRFPTYPDSADYKTNAPSYYEDLARKNKLIEELAKRIWEYDETLADSLAEVEGVLNEVVDKIGGGFNSEIEELLIQWVADGTLDHIINETLMNKKADKEDLQVLSQSLTETMALITQVITPTMSQDEIQALLSEGGSFYFTEGTYLINLSPEFKGYTLSSNTIIRFDKKTTIELTNHEEQYYQIFNITDKENIVLENVVINGRKDLNTETLGEWGMGVSIRGSENISLKNVTCNNLWGDGLYIGSSSNKNYSKNIIAENFQAHGNRRQGISIISVENLYLNNLTITNTKGTLPERAIDIEPNNEDERLINIHINNLFSEKNNGGVLIYLEQLTSYSLPVSISIDGVYSSEDNLPVNVSGKNKISGTIHFNNITFFKSITSPISIRDYNADSIPLYFENVSFIDCLYLSTSTSDTYSTLIGVYTLDTSAIYDIGNVHVKNISIKNSDVVYYKHILSVLHSTTNKNKKNVTIENSHSLESTAMMFYGVGDNFKLTNLNDEYHTKNSITLSENQNIHSTISNKGSIKDIRITTTSTIPNNVPITIKNESPENHTIIFDSYHTLHPLNNKIVTLKNFGDELTFIRNGDLTIIKDYIYQKDGV